MQTPTVHAPVQDKALSPVRQEAELGSHLRKDELWHRGLARYLTFAGGAAIRPVLVIAVILAA